MVQALKPPCELGNCNYFDLIKMDYETRQYIFKKCRESLEARLSRDPNFQATECPQAAITAAVITKLAIDEGELQITENDDAA